VSEKRESSGNVTRGGGDPDHSSGPGQTERSLPPELRSFEAALASLQPTAGGLDCDLIMFRAGQLSVARKTCPGSRAFSTRSRAMPVALGAMTAAAAVLLVMLLTRPVVERVEIVRIPAVEPGNGVAEEDDLLPGRNHHTGERQPVVRRAAGQEDRPSHFGSDLTRSRAATLELIAWMLQHGADPWGNHVELPTESLQAAKAPVPYIEQLREVLGKQARAPASRDWPNLFFHLGAES